MGVILYTTGCPQCKVLKQKLDEKHIDYEIVNDLQRMADLGFTAAPMLDVEGKVMNYPEAFAWINKIQ